MGLPWPFALRRTPAAAQAPGQAGSGCSRALFGQPLAALCGEDGSLPRPIQELLAALHREGPSTEGIFRRAASGTEFRELREALDHGADVDLGSQPALLLAVILKDFLRSIPAKLLVTDLYEDWMAAMQKSGKEEKMEELKAVAEKLPAANLLLLKRLLALLQHIGHNASTSRMTASNLAICLGPNLLSPPNEDLLPLQAMLEVTEKVGWIQQPAAALPAHQNLAAQRSLAASSPQQMLVNVLLLFMIEHCGDIFGEEMDGRRCPSAWESPAPTDRATDLHLEEQSGPPGRADQEHQAEALVHTSPSLDVFKEAGGDTVVQSETAEPMAALEAALGSANLPGA
ncbi:T-cell activation Rho GTPase-activating protein-like [Morphnus guianensis]